MKKWIFLFASFTAGAAVWAQQPQFAVEGSKPQFYNVKTVKATPVKNQAMTGTCWSFSSTSLVESDALRSSIDQDLSEMFTVRNIYLEKAKNYILRGGRAQFGEGGLGHDVIRAIGLYGAMPESAYSGLAGGQKEYNHQRMFSELQAYLDSVLKKQPINPAWIEGYTAILDWHMGTPPATFTVEGKAYNAKSYAKEVLRFNESDYVTISSFTHVPYYKPFILQVPDNFSNGSFYNLPLNEMVELVKGAVAKGYSIGWDADVSNKGFRQEAGLALLVPQDAGAKDIFHPEMKELPYDAGLRQQLYENLTTQDDHLMHIVGVETSKDGKTFFIVKNSWGKVGPFEGMIHVSESYFAVNTVSLVVPRGAVSKELAAKLKL